MYVAGVLTGLYNAFVINKALVWFLPQYSQILNVIQIWVIVSIYSIITTKIEDNDKKEEASVILARSFMNTAIKVAALSIALLGFYIVKCYS
jgi:hypothetical protein